MEVSKVFADSRESISEFLFFSPQSLPKSLLQPRFHGSAWYWKMLTYCHLAEFHNLKSLIRLLQPADDLDCFVKKKEHRRMKANKYVYDIRARWHGSKYNEYFFCPIRWADDMWMILTRNMCRHMTWELSTIPNVFLCRPFWALWANDMKLCDMFGSLWLSHVLKHHRCRMVKHMRWVLNSVLENIFDAMRKCNRPCTLWRPCPGTTSIISRKLTAHWALGHGAEPQGEPGSDPACNKHFYFPICLVYSACHVI